ncbi:MAG: Dabb family protein [Nitrospinota bacterium]|nr:Dabb family protein [Nitrospinota bacterium]MDH5678428.1 Dabb family protein [Nitrospinota bacterium]MDH5755986.1 Dabb family protein [Nitrospinota bacterium]
MFSIMAEAMAPTPGKLDKMIRHIVFFKFRPQTVERDKETLAGKLEALKDSISLIRKLQVGTDLGGKPNSYDMALDATFDSMEDVEAYAVHPEHVKVLDTIARICEATAKVDYESED